MAIAKRTFNQSDLNGSNQLVFTHNLNTQDIVPALKDNLGNLVNMADIFWHGNATRSNPDNVVTIDLSGYVAISGTWSLLLSYTSSGEAGGGRRAFELTENTDPEDTFRFIVGKQDTPSVNISFASLYTLLMTKLGFLKVDNDLSDLNNKDAARGNLGVFSQAEVLNLTGGKASLYQTGSGAVLGVNNTAVYKGSDNYNPAVMRDVRNVGGRMLLAGVITSTGGIGVTFYRNTDLIDTFEASKLGTGLYRVTHNFGSYEYIVTGSTSGSAAAPMYFGRVEKNTTYFDISTGDDSSKNDSAFEFIMWGFNSYIPD